ncbi:hypothetical protein MZK47_05705 [Microbacterium aerolatum]|uniref:hypothetical protein n=1 Tax=Microbacterium aerolatum TaxID=153731 RepID=UPI002001B755|nr:hypothetical protein [Microbacterium aerolatum]MCK3769160.1 hypothetical protein [Microbacterium aerolatum]
MAIKKRPPVDPAAIEAFGAAADVPQAAATPTPEAAPEHPREVERAKKVAQGEWPEGLAKTLLIRWPDANLALELADVAKLEDRSQHKTALRALQRGLEVLRAEHGS